MISPRKHESWREYWLNEYAMHIVRQLLGEDIILK